MISRRAGFSGGVFCHLSVKALGCSERFAILVVACRYELSDAFGSVMEVSNSRTFRTVTNKMNSANSPDVP